MARRFLSGALPFAYDDPENADLVKQLWINTFGGAGMGTEHSQFHAQFAPLITTNEHVMEQLSLAETRNKFLKYLKEYEIISNSLSL